MTQRDFEPLPYYRWYWRDWRADRDVQQMPLEARGLYRELLDECWAHGSIPDLTDPHSAATLAYIASTTPDIVTTCWSHVRPHFRKRGRRLINSRIERERKKSMQAHAAKSDAGKRGAEKRWGGKDSTANGSAIAEDKHPIASSSSNSNTNNSSNRRRSLGPETGPRSPVPVSDVLPEYAHLLTPPVRVS